MRPFIILCRFRVLLGLLFAGTLFGQFDPQGAQVISYIPQLVDGGGSAQQWVTSLTFVNPNQSFSAAGTVYIYGDDGNPLSLNFGTGPLSSFSFSVPAQGTATFKSAGTSAKMVGGWAIVRSTLPIEAVAQFGYSINGITQQAVAAPATEASTLFRSPAGLSTGVAIANPNSTSSVALTVSALDANGNTVASMPLTLGPLAHMSFNVSALFPSLSGNLLFPGLGSFHGTVLIATTAPATYCVAWTLSSDLGALASLPQTGLSGTASQYERISKVWQKLLTVASANFPLGTPPSLIIDQTAGNPINALYSASQNAVDILANLGELFGDSESQLSFVIGHELGHIIQARLGGRLTLVPTDREQDADQYGLLLSLLAGYDPYGAAGALGKLYMASGTVDLLDPDFDYLQTVAGVDPHGSFNTRLSMIFQGVQSICAAPSYRGACAAFKNNFHPLMPTVAPI